MTDTGLNKKSKIALISSGIAMATSANSLRNQATEWYKNKFLYGATLREDSFVFPEIMEYIDAQSNTRSYRFVSTRTGVKKFFNSDGTATFYINGHRLEASLYKPPGSGDASDAFSISTNMKQSLNFTARSIDGLVALENLLADMTKKKNLSEKSLLVGSPTKYGDWDYNNLPKKSMDSVFLPYGMKESLTADVQKFLDSEKSFMKVGLPWHRGYCFYGEPGNGKSSMALAVANNFGLDLHVLPLSSMDSDVNLARAISDIRDQSILLLEDIDIYSHSMERKQSDNSPTLAGLLNALDGVNTPHGLLTIMTTNNFDTLDPALVRPGRMDYKLELKAPVPFQIESMFMEVFDEALGVETKTFESMAAVADVFKRHLDDAEAVRAELTL